MDKLTDREKEVYALVITGQSNKEIGQKFCISNQTVRHHVNHIFSKLGVTSRIELIHWHIRNGGSMEEQS